MGKKITDKIRENLTPEDLKEFETAVNELVEELAVKKASERVALREEEIKKEYDGLAQKFVEKSIKEGMEKEKAALTADYDKKLQALEQKVVSKLDTFLDHVIAEQISDEMLQKIAINETLMPIVENIRNVFKSNHVELDADTEALVAKATKEKEELEGKLSESIARAMEAEERLERTAVYLKISEMTEGLEPSKKARVTKMFKDKPFDEVNEKIETFISVIKETKNDDSEEEVEERGTTLKKKTVTESKKKPRKTADAVLSEGDGLEESKKKQVNEDTGDTLSEAAARFL